MKKILSVIALIMALSLTMACFASCDLFKKPEEEKDQVTVSWYQGSKLLREEKIDKGSKVTSWTPDAIEGKDFEGWFAEASLTEAFDFEATIEADTDIFAKYTSNVFTADEKEYYLIGTGAGDMKDSNWSHTAPDKLKLVRQDVEGANVYKVTITMYAGDRFQICYGSWDGQQGIGIFAGAAYADGVNPNKVAEGQVTAADKKYAEVKNEAGEVVFIGGDENNNSYKNWNAILNEGHDGVYEFTLTTYPNAGDKNNVTFKLIEKISPMTATHSMHLVGEFNSWNAADENATYHLAESQDKATWSGFLTVTADDLAADGNIMFKVVNQVAGTWHPDGMGNDITITEAGTYAVKYTVETNAVEIEKCEYYIVGTLLDAQGNEVNYSVKKGVSPVLVANADGSYSINFEAYDVTASNGYSWMADQGKTDPNGVPAIISIKVVLGAELGIKDWYAAEGGDNWYLAAGTYAVVLANGAVTVTPAN